MQAIRTSKAKNMPQLKAIPSKAEMQFSPLKDRQKVKGIHQQQQKTMNHSNSQSLHSSSMYSLEQRSKQHLKTLDTEGPISSPGLEEPYQLAVVRDMQHPNAAAAHLNEDIAFFSNDAKQHILNYHCKSNLEMRNNDDKSRVKLKYSTLSLKNAILSPKMKKIALERMQQSE